MKSNPFMTALWVIASFGLLVGFVATVGNFGNAALQALVAQGAGGLGSLSLIGGLVASAVTWRDKPEGS